MAWKVRRQVSPEPQLETFESIFNVTGHVGYVCSIIHPPRLLSHGSKSLHGLSWLCDCPCGVTVAGNSVPAPRTPCRTPCPIGAAAWRCLCASWAHVENVSWVDLILCEHRWITVSQFTESN